MPDRDAANGRWRDVFATSLRQESTVWLFVFKTLLACYLSGWLAMRFALPDPSTAMLTTIIVANRQTGNVLAKAFYRAIGTLAGACASLLMVSLFPQQHDLLLLSLSLWIGICAGGATLYRSFMAYGFVLSGYTTAIVVLPIVNQPMEIFNSVLYRVSEVWLALAVSAIVSGVLFPTRMRKDLRRTACAQFAQLIPLVQHFLSDKMARDDLKNASLRFINSALTLENLRSAVVFEDPEVRARSAHMQLFNQHFMAASTSLQTLNRMMDRLRRQHHLLTVKTLAELGDDIGKALDSPIGIDDAARLWPRLDHARQVMHERKAALRAGLTSDNERLEFDVGAALLDRFIEELLAYVSTAAALQTPTPPPPRERVRFHRSNDISGAALAVVRTTLITIAVGLFWIASAWPLGSLATMLTATFASLYAANPRPVHATLELILGIFLGAAACFICVFAILPRMDTYALMVAGTAPFLIAGLVVMGQPSPRIGAFGYYCTAGFVIMLAARDPMVFDSVLFINETLAIVLSLAVVGIAYIIIPPVIGTSWLRRRLLKQLRGQVAFAARAPLPGLYSHFESTSHDLFGQITTQTKLDDQTSQYLIDLALLVREAGRTVIELRKAMAASPPPDTVHAATVHAMDLFIELFEHPGRMSYDYAYDAARAAMALAHRHEGALPLRPHLQLLYLILRDEQSVLAAHGPACPGTNGERYAA